MAETRLQVAYHCKIDPAKLGGITDPERIPLPEQITRTISFGEELTTEKVGLGTLSPWDRKALRDAVAAAIPESTRTARPVGETTSLVADIVHTTEEESAF